VKSQNVTSGFHGFTGGRPDHSNNQYPTVEGIDQTWTLDIPCWLLDIQFKIPGCSPWTLDIPCWILDIENRLLILSPDSCLLTSGCFPWTLDIPCWLLDIQFKIH
jgi:hypothetical protein